ncbi:MAG: glycosyltransferase family 61 protein [Anaerolineales bacterium]|nr:glycosyltransferase family 61 protein [Anaerolineales bacterium]
MPPMTERASRTVKRIAASILRRIPGSRLPQGGIPDYRAWSDSREARLPWLERGWDHWCVTVREAEMVEMPPPITADGTVNPVYRGAQYYRYPPLYLAHVRNGRLLGRDGVVLTSDGRVLEESTFAWGLPPAEWPVFTRLSVPAARAQPGAMLTLLSPVSGKPNYYHWWIDTLPRLAVAEAAGIRHFRIIVPQAMEPWQRESLERLGYPSDRWEPFGDDHWRVESLLFPSLLGYSGMVRPWAANWLRRKIGLPKPAAGKRRIYLRRAKAGFRQVANELELIPILKSFKFEVQDPQGMPLADQMKLFSNAESVVSIHGAGLSNLLFAPAGARVVEFMSPHPAYTNTCYYSLCSAIGHRYAVIFGKHPAPVAAGAGRRWRDDLIVPPEVLQETLSMLLGK